MGVHRKFPASTTLHDRERSDGHFLEGRGRRDYAQKGLGVREVLPKANLGETQFLAVVHAVMRSLCRDVLSLLINLLDEHIPIPT